MNKSNIPSPTNPVPIEKQMDDYQDLGECVDLNCTTIDKLYKIIDLMAQDIANSSIDEDMCRQYKMKDDCYVDCYKDYDNTACVECVKIYYYKKVKS